MLLISVIGLLGLFALNLMLGIKYGFGFRHYWFFETLHFLGGFFMAMFLTNFTSSKILIFVSIAAASFLWEFAEYLLGKIPKLSTGFKKTFDLKKNVNIRPKWQDTVLDIILNFAGAAVFVYFVL
ncbi:MAG: hypothetical protein Q7J30_02730 [Candidatus Azambacteria bacterium]|nr:hypothetical protein [Candidatus Azambacteria bacterium]